MSLGGGGCKYKIGFFLLSVAGLEYTSTSLHKPSMVNSKIHTDSMQIVVQRKPCFAL